MLGEDCVAVETLGALCGEGGFVRGLFGLLEDLVQVVIVVDTDDVA